MICRNNQETRKWLSGEISATVKGNELDCYNWKDGDKLEVIRVLENLDSDNGIYLWYVYNHTKNEFGGVITDQINWLKEPNEI